MSKAKAAKTDETADNAAHADEVEKAQKIAEKEAQLAAMLSGEDASKQAASEEAMNAQGPGESVVTQEEGSPKPPLPHAAELTMGGLYFYQETGGPVRLVAVSQDLQHVSEPFFAARPSAPITQYPGVFGLVMPFPKSLT